MMPVDDAIARTRRDLTVGSVIRYALLVAAAGVVIKGISHPLVFVGFVGVCLVLAYRSALGARLAAEPPALIAAGDYDEAERRIEHAVRSFSPSRTAKLLNLHHLAVLRHAQRRWAESARLCQALLRLRPGTPAGLSRSSRLMLADAMLELGDAAGAYRAIDGLYGQRLTLAEAMNLLVVQLDYQSRVGDWGGMASSIASKAQMAELLPTERSARAQALLALAARRTGRTDWDALLRRRAELLADVRELVARRSVLSELWTVPSAEVQPPGGFDTKM